MAATFLAILNMFSEFIINQDADIRNKFRNYIEHKDIKVARIAAKLDIDRSHFRRILIQERELTETNRAKLNEYLGTNF